MIRIKKGKKKTNEFYTKGGEGFKSVIFYLCRRLIQEEKFPKVLMKQTWCNFTKEKDPGIYYPIVASFILRNGYHEHVSH